MKDESRSIFLIPHPSSFPRDSTMTSADGSRQPHFTLHHDAWGRLVLTDAQGRVHVGVDPIRAFPITDPRRGLAICDADGREVLWIDDLDAVSPAVRPLLEDE